MDEKNNGARAGVPGQGAGKKSQEPGRDLVRESAQAGRVVLFEEAPRDGAQAKTLMSADFRVRLAREQGAIFGTDGPRHVVYAAGFPAVCPQEFEAVRQVAIEAQESVSVTVVCRCIPDDIRQAVKAMRGAKHSRVMVIIPASQTMLDIARIAARDAMPFALDMVKEAVDHTGGEVAVDVIFGDVPRADVGLVADYAGRMTAEGAGLIVLADTIGDLIPSEARTLFSRIVAGAGADVVLGAHLHNDLGLALANTLAAMESGVRVPATSWLGFAERSGMAATEQLLFLLAYRPDRAAELMGTTDPLWWTEPDLTRLPRIAEMVSEETGVPLTVTTPIVGSGVATTCAGTHFLDPQRFQPFDPQKLLGIEQRTVLTQLASRRVIREVAERLGYDDLSPKDIETAMTWVKNRAFRLNEPVVSDSDFGAYLEGLTSSREPAGA